MQAPVQLLLDSRATPLPDLNEKVARRVERLTTGYGRDFMAGKSHLSAWNP
jgi:hypothetical protein